MRRASGRANGRVRAVWQARIASQLIVCPRCWRPILPDQVWDLDHVDLPVVLGGTDVAGGARDTRVPAHASCNRSHGARLRNQLRGSRGYRP